MRYLVAYASLIIPLIGPLLVVALSPLFDIERRRRGWLDLAAATWFVDIRRGLNPYDQKRMRIARKRVKTPEHEEKAPLPSLATPVDRDAPAEYVPSARLSGGVIGAHRSSTTPAVPAVDAPAAGSMVSAVPPSLATAAQSASAVQAPAPAAASPSAQAAAPATFAPPAPAQAAPAQAAPAEAPSMPPLLKESAAASPPAAESRPAASAAEASGSGVRAVLVLDNGDRVEVRGTTLFGRSPSAAAGEGGAELVRVFDDTRSVSKTHIAIMPARRGVFVVDRASTNGSAIVRRGSETALVAGHPAELQRGDVVRFGDRTLQVEWL